MTADRSTLPPCLALPCLAGADPPPWPGPGTPSSRGRLSPFPPPAAAASVRKGAGDGGGEVVRGREGRGLQAFLGTWDRRTLKVDP